MEHFLNWKIRVRNLCLEGQDKLLIRACNKALMRKWQPTKDMLLDFLMFKDKAFKRKRKKLDKHL